MSIRFGRVVDLVTDRGGDANLRLGLEAIESETGRLLETAAAYAGEGTSFTTGDVLFGKLRPYLAKSWVADREGTAVGDFHIYRPKAAAHSRYVHYVTLSRAFLDPVVSSVYGAKMPRASWDFVRNVEVTLPSIDQQQAIADYLDRETAQIDTLIAKQEQLIERLGERRTSVISSAAVGSFIPFGDSRSVRVGAMFSVVLGKMLDAGRERPKGAEDLPYIRAANVQDAGLSLQDVNVMPFTGSEAVRLDLRTGDLLVVEGGAIGTSVLLDAAMPGWSFQKTVNRVRSTGAASTNWLKYVLRAYRDSGVIDMICTGSTIPHFTAEKLRALRVPVIPAAEQHAIAAYLDEQTAKIDALIAKARRFIALAKERRAALITAAVTGQIDVTTRAA